MADNVIRFPETEAEGSELLRRLSREAKRQSTTVNDHYDWDQAEIDNPFDEMYPQQQPIRVRIEQPRPSTAQSILAFLVYFAQGALGVLMIAFLIKQIFGG